MIIGWFLVIWIIGLFPPSLGDVVAVASQGRFFCFCLHPSLGDVVADASQGRFFVFVLRILTQKGHFWLNKVISGPDFLKNCDIWSDLVILDLL